MEDKANFVRELGEILTKYTAERTGVKELRYTVRPRGDEILDVISERGYRRSIIVTGDSCLAIMHDVYRALI